jgi:hypothetical protein
MNRVRQGPHQPAPRPGRQLRIRRLPDELIPPQRHLLGTLRPSTRLVID